MTALNAWMQAHSDALCVFSLGILVGLLLPLFAPKGYR